MMSLTFLKKFLNIARVGWNSIKSISHSSTMTQCNKHVLLRTAFSLVPVLLQYGSGVQELVPSPPSSLLFLLL